MRLVQSQAENASHGQDPSSDRSIVVSEVSLRSQYAEQGPYLHCALPGTGRTGAGETSIQQLKQGLKAQGWV